MTICDILVKLINKIIILVITFIYETNLLCDGSPMSLFKIFDLKQIVSPITWINIAIICYSCILILFSPSIKNIIILFLIDAILAFVFAPIFEYLSTKRYGIYNKLFYGVDHLFLKNMSLKDKKIAYKKLLDLPLKRAVGVLVISLIKLIFVGCIGQYILKSQLSGNEFFWAALLTGSISAFYLFGMCYFQTRNFLSDWIIKIDKEHDWSDLFVNYTPDQKVKKRNSFGVISHISIWTLIIITQSYIMRHEAFALDEKILFLGIATVFGLVFSLNIHHVQTNSSYKSLEDSFKDLSKIHNSKRNPIPLSANPDLLDIQWKVNQLVKNLNSSEKQVSNWLMHYSEKKRFTDLGELAGLIIHDIAAPLHVIQFCALELYSKEHEGNTQQYLSKLIENSRVVLELVDSLRKSLRTSKGDPKISRLPDVISSAIRIVSFQFKESEMDLISINIDPEIEKLNVNFPRPELIQVLLNMLANSIKNLLDNESLNPQISISVVKVSGDKVLLSIKDNGSGIGEVRFNKMTEISNMEENPIEEKEAVNEGLGLKLTKRIIEKNKGSLVLVDSEVGTEYHLKLINNLI